MYSLRHEPDRALDTLSLPYRKDARLKALRTSALIEMLGLVMLQSCFPLHGFASRSRESQFATHETSVKWPRFVGMFPEFSKNGNFVEPR